MHEQQHVEMAVKREDNPASIGHDPKPFLVQASCIQP